MGVAVLIAATPGIACAAFIAGYVGWEMWQDRRRARALDSISEVE